MKYLYLVVWLLLVSSCETVVEKQLCDRACELKQEVATLQMQNNTQRLLIHDLATKVEHFERTRDNLCEDCRKHELTMDDCHPMGKSGEWNVALKHGFPGDEIVPYVCSSMTGSPISKYPPAFRQLWHAKANECIFRVQDILDDPNGELGYGGNGVNVTIKWKSPPNKRKWAPKKSLKRTL